MVDVQKESQIEEDIPEERQMILITIPNRRSRSLKEKKGHQYQTGQIAVSASRRKVLLSELAPGISHLNIDVLSLVPDDMLLFLAEICDIEMGIDNIKTNNMLTQLRSLDASKKEVENRTKNQCHPLQMEKLMDHCP